MDFKFDAKQPYQLEAIASVVDLFDGPAEGRRGARHHAARRLGCRRRVRAVVLDIDLTQRSGRSATTCCSTTSRSCRTCRRCRTGTASRSRPKLAGDALDFDIEMETGTGKTYVYLRTIFELAQKYNFRKFVILVPSVADQGRRHHQHQAHARALREPLRRALRCLGLQRQDRRGGAVVRDRTNVQILIMTIDSIRGDANSRIIHQTRDKLNGLRPIDYLKATHPVVIMDEPQNMESQLSQSAVGELDPLCTLRYSRDAPQDSATSSTGSTRSTPTTWAW